MFVETKLTLFFRMLCLVFIVFLSDISVCFPRGESLNKDWIGADQRQEKK